MGVEVNEAIRIDAETHGSFIIPVKIYDAVFDSEEGWTRIMLQRRIGDFRNWKNTDSYRVAFKQLEQEILEDAG